MQTMYPGQINSPQTELADSIDDSQTSIDVVDGDALPAAPNLAVIGQGAGAETVLYGGKSGDTLTSVTRGFQGAAATHPAGSKVARNFTAYDYDALIRNVGEVSWYAVTSNSGNNYSATLSPAPSAYAAGMVVRIKVNADSSGNVTINFNGLGAKSVKKANGNNVNNFKQNAVYTLVYNGSDFIQQGEGGGGDAQPGDVLSGKTFTNDTGEQTGTGANAKRSAAGTASSGTNLYVVSGLAFRPSKVICKYYGNASYASLLVVLSDSADMRVNWGGTGVDYLNALILSGAQMYSGNFDTNNFINSSGFGVAHPVSGASGSLNWWAYE